jgi:hypothetical protein
VAYVVFKCDFGFLAISASGLENSPNPLLLQVKDASREFDEVWLISRDFDMR